ncbi:MAG: hypothetical protein AB4911_17660 [Oscillochloridaceae bacterium umkhey_bin13]
MDASILVAGTFPFVFILVSIIIDALMLFQLKWANLQGSFRDSAIANLISAVVIALVSPLILSVGNVFLALLVAFLVAWVADGFALILLRRRTASASYLAALVINFTSFIFAYAYVFTFILI